MIHLVNTFSGVHRSHTAAGASPVGIAALMLSWCRSRAAHSGPSRVPSRSSALMRVSKEASSPISLHQEPGIRRLHSVVCVVTVLAS